MCILYMTIDIVAHVQSLDQIEQRTPEWYSARQNMLTASDVATVLGINPYEKYQSIVDKKSYGTNTFFGNAATAHGQKHEDTARFLFGRMYGLETWDVGLFRHTEIKCPLKRAIKHEIPAYYYPQVQLCMEILKIPKCYFIQYYPETMVQDGLLDVVEIPRSTQWFAENFPKMETFWQTVLHNRDHPELQTIKPKRERKVKEPIVQECLIVSDPEDGYPSEDES